MFNKFKQNIKKFVTGKSGFSLVELIVVIAIMAVMAAVLAPALLGYVEKSRMQKDDSAMDEVVNAIQLSLADQEIYDEVLEHSVWDNVSCYIDKKDESQFASYKVQLKAEHGDKKEQYMFGDEARLLDETVYFAAGNMRGLTITFSPSESGDTYDFANGVLNKFVGRKTGLLSENPELYNRLRSVIGDKLDTTSQTYRNSDYTIFIRVGSTGGSEAVMQDAIQVWGQFNGTNLTEKDHKYELSSGRVVGTTGANDASNNQTNNENGNVDFSENATQLKTVIIDGVSYQYQEGMTWVDWCDSNYNTLGLQAIDFIYDASDKSLRYNCTYINSPSDTLMGLLENNSVYYIGTEVLRSDLILEVKYSLVDKNSLSMSGWLESFNDIHSHTREGYYVSHGDGMAKKHPVPTNAICIMTIDGVEYQYREGMTWAEWIDSDYNTLEGTLQKSGTVYYNKDNDNKSDGWIFSHLDLVHYYTGPNDDYDEGRVMCGNDKIYSVNYSITFRSSGTVLETYREMSVGTKYFYTTDSGVLELRIKRH